MVVKNAMISLLPLDVGFDYRDLEMTVTLPKEKSLTVQYINSEGRHVKQTGNRPHLVDQLRENGYLVE